MEQAGGNLQMSEPLHSNSQLSEQASSLSLPSEPPDVRKWFSSYVYESPALGSDKAFLASSLEGGKCQNYSFCSEARHREEDESPLDFGNVTKIDRAVSSKKTDSNLSTEAEINEVPDSLQSETQLSEPPDVRNWFSSYVYESPELSIECGEDSSKEIRCSGEGVADEKRKIEAAFGAIQYGKVCRGAGDTGERLNCDERVTSAKELNQDPYLRKVASSSESTSQLSDLPHISNWFSSYVYESPELSLGESFLVEKESLEDVFATEGSSGAKRENLGSHASPKVDETELQIMFPSKQATHRPCQERDELSEEGNLSAQDVPTFNIFSMEHSESRNTVECNRSPQVDLEESWLNGSGAEERLTQESIEEPKITALHADLVDAPARNMISRGLGAENERADTNSDGFVRVKCKVSRRSNDENDSRRPWSVLKECSSSKERASCMAAQDGIKRRPLSETTNFHGCLDAPGSAGKWKCPQKSKPNLGPPMKQLRLEKWVHIMGK